MRNLSLVVIAALALGAPPVHAQDVDVAVPDPSGAYVIVDPNAPDRPLVAAPGPDGSYVIVDPDASAGPSFEQPQAPSFDPQMPQGPSFGR